MNTCASHLCAHSFGTKNTGGQAASPKIVGEKAARKSSRSKGCSSRHARYSWPDRTSGMKPYLTLVGQTVQQNELEFFITLMQRIDLLLMG